MKAVAHEASRCSRDQHRKEDVERQNVAHANVYLRIHRDHQIESRRDCQEQDLSRAGQLSARDREDGNTQQDKKRQGRLDDDVTGK